jgi:adenylosuccinate synthase
VGSGPFPTELEDETGEEIRRIGREFGATTGRPRRCGWLDLPALKYSILINGVTQLIMTKADVLSGFDTVRVCTSYRSNGLETDRFPFDIDSKFVEPVYTDLPGWKEDLTGIRNESDFPANLNSYIQFVEKQLGVKITIVSVGPDREQTIIR